MGTPGTEKSDECLDFLDWSKQDNQNLIWYLELEDKFTKFLKIVMFHGTILLSVDIFITCYSFLIKLLENYCVCVHACLCACMCMCV